MWQADRIQSSQGNVGKKAIYINNFFDIKVLLLCFFNHSQIKCDKFINKSYKV